MTLLEATQAFCGPVSRYVVNGESLDSESPLYGGAETLEAVTAENLDSPALELSHDYGANYGHWLHDFLPILLLLRSKGHMPKVVELCQVTYHSLHTAFWCHLLGIERSLVMKDSDKQRVRYPLSLTSLVHPEALRLLREFIPLARSVYPYSHRPILLIQRSQFGASAGTSRNLATRSELLALFRDTGIEVVYLEGTPCLQQIAMFSSASLIVAVHGTALSNVVFCQKDCKVIEIRSPLFWNCTYAQIGGYLGLDYTLIHGAELTGNTNLYSHAVHVPADALAQLIRTKAKQQPLCSTSIP